MSVDVVYPDMRIYPATLKRVFENKLDEGHGDADEIPFGKEDLQRALDELDLDVRDPMEIASAYSTSRALPDEIKEHGFSDIVLDEEYEGAGDMYKFVK
jgi:hypothetical protein